MRFLWIGTALLSLLGLLLGLGAVAESRAQAREEAACFAALELRDELAASPWPQWLDPDITPAWKAEAERVAQKYEEPQALAFLAAALRELALDQELERREANE